jgi:methylisocitrate lyase
MTDSPIAAATSAAQKRARFRELIAAPELTQLPGAPDALVAKLIQRIGFPGVYLSGAVMSNVLGLPDIGLTTLTEVTAHARRVARATDLPLLVDADTGFGEPMSAARTVAELEDAGVAGCHLEDQVNPKRCGHLDGAAVVGTDEMVRRIRAAVSARRDPNFVICARTDGRSVESFDDAVDRAKAYADAGADLIFAEALADAMEFEKFVAAVPVPVLANMTEFGKSELLDVRTLESAGVSVAIYPVTALRLAMFAIENGLRHIHDDGTQLAVLDEMQHRRDLYDLLDYAAYNQFDNAVFTYAG